MPVEDQNSSIEEIAPLDPQEVNVVEPDETQAKENIAAQEEESQKKNWRELRRNYRDSQAREKAKDEIIEKFLKAQKGIEEPKIEEDEFSKLDQDDYLTKRQTDKRIEIQSEAIAERKYKQMQEKDKRDRFLSRLKKKYKDFAEVVNNDSIAVFEEEEPELAETIAELKDPYKIGLQTYKFLKKMQVSEKVDKKIERKEVEDKLKKNENTIQSPLAYDKRPMAQAFRGTKEEAADLYKEMISSAAKVGYGY